MLSDLLSTDHANTTPKMAAVDVAFLALGLVVASGGLFFLFQSSIAEAATQGLEKTSVWLAWIYFPLLNITSLLSAFLALGFLVQANLRNQGSMVILALLSFGLMTMPLMAASTQDALMARSHVLSLLMDIRDQGHVSSEENRLLQALVDNDETAINQASLFLPAKDTQELIGIAQTLGMDTQAMKNQGFATQEQLEAVMEEASLQAAPLNVLNWLSQFQARPARLSPPSAEN